MSKTRCKIWEDNNMCAMGRPKKLKDGRSPYTMYLGDGIRKAIDDYVYEVKRVNPDYSRSDFLNEAAEFYLKELAKEESYNKDRENQQD